MGAIRCPFSEGQDEFSACSNDRCKALTHIAGIASIMSTHHLHAEQSVIHRHLSVKENGAVIAAENGILQLTFFE